MFEIPIPQFENELSQERIARLHEDMALFMKLTAEKDQQRQLTGVTDRNGHTQEAGYYELHFDAATLRSMGIDSMYQSIDMYFNDAHMRDDPFADESDREINAETSAIVIDYHDGTRDDISIEKIDPFQEPRYEVYRMVCSSDRDYLGKHISHIERPNRIETDDMPELQDLLMRIFVNSSDV